MKKVLIVTALSQELNFVKSEIKKLNLIDFKISYFSTWMGNYNMVLNLTKFLSENKDFDFILNIWICGYKDEFKDFFQVLRIFNFSNSKELIVPKIIDFWENWSIFCSEKIVFDEKILKDENFVDMESYWFELVCDNFSISRIILKVPVDKIWKETKNFSFEKAEKFLKEKINYEKLFLEIKKYLEKLPQKQDFEKFFKYFNFTFSEKEIFKKLFYKFNALTSENFDLYFLENKDFEKKVFLKNLDNYLKKYLL